MFSPPLVLNLYPGSAGGYSVRRLSSSYFGSSIRVRRSSDNAEQDIGFLNGELNQASLTAFTGVSNGFITKWYDQSGNGNDLVQAAVASQPQIVAAGVVQTTNGKPSINFDGVNDFFNLTTGISSTPNWSSFMVGKKTAMGTVGPMLSNTDNNNAPETPMHYSDSNFYIKSSGATVWFAADATTAQELLTGVFNGAGAFIWKNNGALSLSNFAGAAGSGFATFGAKNAATNYTTGSAQEFIFYSSDQTANRSAINTNINSYFAIY